MRRKYLNVSFLLFKTLILHWIYAVDVSINEKVALDLTNPHSFKNVSFIIQPSTYRYVLVQAVAQTRSISISHSSSVKYGNHFNSTAVALVFMLKGNENRVHSYFATTDISTKAQAIAVPYFRKDPIPGGCCITCAFDNDPNIKITKEPMNNALHFQRANVYYDSGKMPEPCDGGQFSTFRLEYDLYMYQLTENDFTEGDLFRGMSKMASTASMKKYGMKVGTIKESHKTMYPLQSIPYEGVIYNIIVRDTKLQTEAAYAPAFVYGCDIDDKKSCRTFGSVTSIVYAVVSGIIGIALCFAGHKFLKIEILFGGILSGFLISYILLLRFANIGFTASMLSSTAVGVAFGAILLLVYMQTSLFYPIFLNNALLIGFLVACSTLFSPLGNLHAFSSNTVFILTFVCIMLVCPIPLLFFPKIISILFSSLIGGYIALTACSFFLHATLQYIVLEFILRAGIPSFADSYLRVPFENNEIILCGVWGFLTITGSLSQYFMTRKDPFPPSSKRGKRSSGRRKASWFVRRRRKATNQLFDERTPLMQNDNMQCGYGGTASLDKYQPQPINIVL